MIDDDGKCNVDISLPFENLEKAELLTNAFIIDARTGEPLAEDGEGVVDLIHPFAVPGKLENGEIVIDDLAVIYSCEDGI